jgi:DNA-binding helix-hairpin-helix protein with protein kinase domain
MSTFVTSSGRNLQLGSVLGKGGEGTIFDVVGDGALAVKIYTDGKEADRREKLNAMIADRFSTKTPFVAAPIETVVTNGAIVGFTMKKAIGGKTVHLLCLPSDRIAEFPQANFRFLIHAALNYAKSVASIHSLGAIIGDVNESGALVNQSGLITLIDSDSFQYRSGGRVFRCKVGKPEYTPPELQGQQFGKIERTINHDAFGIAVIIFELLFMGRHPFSGIYKGSGGQPTIAEAIQRGRFAYSSFKSATMMEPPPYVPVLADIPVDVAEAFQQAFELNSAKPRPTAGEWVALMETMERGTLGCSANPAHFYSKNAASCPWCRFEAGLGTILFIARETVSRSTFDLERAISLINNIQNPGSAPDLASLMSHTGHLTTSKAVKDFKSNVMLRRGAGLAALGLAVFLMFSGISSGFFVLIPAGFLLLSEASGKRGIQEQCSRVREAWNRSLTDWDRNAGNGRFNERKAELIRAATSYRGLPAKERDELAQLEKKKVQLQMRRHLEAHKIDRARIDSIGDSRKLTLRSFGVGTAWDVTAQKVRAVPGFGTVLTEKLLSWRRSIEGRFKFNPNIPTDPAEIAVVRSDIAKQRASIETDIIRGARDLELIKAEALNKRRSPTDYRQAYLEFKQAEIDAASL